MSSTNPGSPQSLNLYSYTQNNPIDFTDPSGLLMYAPPSHPPAPYGPNAWDEGDFSWLYDPVYDYDYGGGEPEVPAENPCEMMAKNAQNIIDALMTWQMTNRT